jgi:hypothetical protein
MAESPAEAQGAGGGVDNRLSCSIEEIQLVNDRHWKMP